MRIRNAQPFFRSAHAALKLAVIVKVVAQPSGALPALALHEGACGMNETKKSPNG